MALLFLSGCFEKDNYTQEECEELSMKSFKGIPRDAHKFKKYCGQYKILYTKARCQKALNDFALYGNLESTSQKYGSKIKGCFSKADIKNFSKK